MSHPNPLKTFPVRLPVTDFSGLQVSPLDWFLLSRIDGATHIHALGQITGQTDDQVVAACRRLETAGLIQVEMSPSAQRAVLATPEGAWPASGSRSAFSTEDRISTQPRAKSRTSSGNHRAEPDPRASKNSGNRQALEVPPTIRSVPRGESDPLSGAAVPTHWPVRFEAFMFDPLEMATGSALTDRQKQVVLYYHYHLRKVTYYDLFHIGQTADRDETKRAYFWLSKGFHPDRWFRKDTGVFGAKIEEVFVWLNRAYSVLSSPRRRHGYDLLLAKGYIGEWQLEESGQRREPNEQEQAKRSLDVHLARARRAESESDWRGASEHYARAVETSPCGDLQLKFLTALIRTDAPAPRVRSEFERAALLGASQISLLGLRAEFETRLGDAAAATETYRELLQLDPNHAIARNALDRTRSRPLF